MKTDTLPQQEVMAELKWKTDAQDIPVQVHGTEVTLTGKVHSWSEREGANDSAWGTPAVRNLVDQMTMTL